MQATAKFWRTGGAGPVGTCLVAMSCLAVGLWVLRRCEKALQTTWLGRILAFVARLSQDRSAETTQRIDTMARAIAARLRAGSIDEVLVVGYSVGSILAVSAVARALRESIHDAGADADTEPALSLLTVGHCIPLLGMLPGASGFRDELRRLASHPALTWFDFSAPGDWGSFALIDPLAACRVETTERPHAQPMMRSPRFHTLFSETTYARLRRDKRDRKSVV